MLPPDVANNLRVQMPDPRPSGPNAGPGQTQLTPPTQRLGDALSNMIPGQRVLAEIQAQLPNGAYRASIAQRDITLSLPFAAKAGDSLELEVVENDGRLALAVVARHGGKGEGGAGGEQGGVRTSFSQIANFIAGLMPRHAKGEQAQPALLNANQPISRQPPTDAADLVPLLKQAITQSGMFYESHQSRWVGQSLPLETLLLQPQGKFSMPRPEAAAQPGGQQAGSSGPAAAGAALAGEAANAAESAASRAAAQAGTETVARVVVQTPQQPVAPDLLPLVQQQLEALATQTYVWQGQAWPGQAMQWEITEENGGRDGEGAEAAPWQTRLMLTLPELGEVRAAIRFVAGEVSLSLSAVSPDSALRLSSGGDALRQQLEAAGLSLGGFAVARHEPPEE